MPTPQRAPRRPQLARTRSRLALILASGGAYAVAAGVVGDHSAWCAPQLCWHSAYAEHNGLTSGLLPARPEPRTLVARCAAHSLNRRGHSTRSDRISWGEVSPYASLVEESGRDPDYDEYGKKVGPVQQKRLARKRLKANPDKFYDDMIPATNNQRLEDAIDALMKQESKKDEKTRLKDMGIEQHEFKRYMRQTHDSPENRQLYKELDDAFGQEDEWQPAGFGKKARATRPRWTPKGNPQVTSLDVEPQRLPGMPRVQAGLRSTIVPPSFARHRDAGVAALEAVYGSGATLGHMRSKTMEALMAKRKLQNSTVRPNNFRLKDL